MQRLARKTLTLETTVRIRVVPYETMRIVSLLAFWLAVEMKGDLRNTSDFNCDRVDIRSVCRLLWPAKNKNQLFPGQQKIKETKSETFMVQTNKKAKSYRRPQGSNLCHQR